MTKELRIGNLVRDKVSKTELKVVELTENHITTYVIDREMFPLREGWGIEAIPLTKEWFLKFGFEHIDLGFESDELLDIVFIFNSGVCQVTVRNEYTLNEFKHVHQLQNLYFALTGKELTIKN